MTTQLDIRHKPLMASQVDYFLVDGSGSMLNKWWDFMASMDAYVTTLKTQNLNSHLVVTTFDENDVHVVQRDQLLRDAPNFHEAPLSSTWSTTPLYDAINAMTWHLRELDPERCSIVIVTDGGDTGNKYTTLEQAHALLDWCRAKGWSVTFIGCEFNNSAQARLLGADPASAIGVSQARLVDAAKSLAEKRMRYAHGADNMHFTDDEKQQFGGYLNAPGQ